MAEPTGENRSEDGEPAAPATDAAPDRTRVRRTARARAQAQQLRTRADDKVRQLESRRPANRWIDAGFSTLERDVTSGGGVLAAALAFRIFIFLVPFVFVVITAIPIGADAADADPTEVADRFGMAGLVATAIRSADDLSVGHRITVLVAATFALVLAGRSLVRVLRITHGLAWQTRVPKLRRPTRAALVLILVVLALVAFGALSARLHDRVGYFGLIPLVLSGVAVTALWTFVQYKLPHADTPWTKLIPGAVLVGLGAQVLQIATVVWFSRYIESKSSTYGAIGAALAILLWAYFLGRIIVSGAMLNAALHEQDTRRAPPAPPRAAPPPVPQSRFEESPGR